MLSKGPKSLFEKYFIFPRFLKPFWLFQRRIKKILDYLTKRNLSGKIKENKKMSGESACPK